MEAHRLSRGRLDARNHVGIQEYLKRRSGEQYLFILRLFFFFQKTTKYNDRLTFGCKLTVTGQIIVDVLSRARAPIVMDS